MSRAKIKTMSEHKRWFVKSFNPAAASMIDWQRTLKCMRATLSILEMFSVSHAKCECCWWNIRQIKLCWLFLAADIFIEVYTGEFGCWVHYTHAEAKPFITRSTDDRFLHSSKVNKAILWSYNNKNILTTKWPEYWIGAQYASRI